MSMLKRTWVEWFLIVYFFALLVRGIWFILHLPPLGMIIALFLLALFVWCVWQFKDDEKRAEAQEKRLGYRVLYLSSNTLRMGPEDWAFEYRKQGESFLLYGDREQKELPYLNIPSAETWDSVVPGWAKGRRQEILQRVRGEMGRYRYTIREI